MCAYVIQLNIIFFSRYAYRTFSRSFPSLAGFPFALTSPLASLSPYLFSPLQHSYSLPLHKKLLTNIEFTTLQFFADEDFFQVEEKTA